MSLTDTQKVDFLWKRIVYQMTETNTGVKQGFEESIGSLNPIIASNIMSQAVPSTAPGVTVDPLQYYGTSNALKMTSDVTVTGNHSWFATTTFNTISTRVGMWIPPSFDPSYLVEVYKNDPTVPANKLNQGTVGYDWVFDYNSGVLTFPNSVPAGITTLWLVGHRYVGRLGLKGAGAPIYEDSLTVSGLSNPVTTDLTFTNFFTYLPSAHTITVFINSAKLISSEFSVSGSDLTVKMSLIQYPLENGDVVASEYGYAS